MFILLTLAIVTCLVAQEETTTSQEPEAAVPLTIRLDEFAKMYAEKAKVNLVLTQEIEKKITIYLPKEDISPLRFLELVVEMNGYKLEQKENIYFLQEIKKETTTTTEPGAPGVPGVVAPGAATEGAAAGAQMAIPTNFFQILRTPVENVEPKIRGLMSPQAKLEINREANAFYILDETPENLQKIKEYVDFINLDPTPAVEARMVQRVFKVNRITPENLEAAVQKLVSDKGKYSIDRGSMTMIVVEREEVLNKIDEFIREADQPEPQLYIRCHFIEVNVSAGTLFGTQFQIDNLNLGNHITSGEKGVGFDMTPSISGSGSFFSISNPTNEIEAYISSQANRSNLRILSSPNLLCYNRQKSMIEIVVEEPYYQATTQTEAGLTTKTVEFKEVGIKLEVTPEIYRDGTVKMNLKPEVSEVVRTFDGIPVIKTKSTESNVMAKDGQTVVIGGILEDQVRKERYKVPLLGDIPLLGLLFSREDQSVKKTELVVFLNITLMNDGIIKSMADSKWKEQEEKFQKFDTEFEFYPHMKEKLEMEKLNPRYDQGSTSKSASSKVSVSSEPTFEFYPQK